MADLITTKASFPKTGGLAVANGAVSVNAGNGLHVNSSTGMVEVPIDTAAGLGYGSNGLEVEVDDSTIGFNSSGQLQALGGGGSGLKPFVINDVGKLGTGTALEEYTFYDPVTSGTAQVSGLYGDKCVILLSMNFVNRKTSSNMLINVFQGNAAPTVNNTELNETYSYILGCLSYYDVSKSTGENTYLSAKYSGYSGGALLYSGINYSNWPIRINTPIVITWP